MAKKEKKGIYYVIIMYKNGTVYDWHTREIYANFSTIKFILQFEEFLTKKDKEVKNKFAYTTLEKAKEAQMQALASSMINGDAESVMILDDKNNILERISFVDATPKKKTKKKKGGKNG